MCPLTDTESKLNGKSNAPDKDICYYSRRPGYKAWRSKDKHLVDLQDGLTFEHMFLDAIQSPNFILHSATFSRPAWSTLQYNSYKGEMTILLFVYLSERINFLPLQDTCPSCTRIMYVLYKNHVRLVRKSCLTCTSPISDLYKIHVWPVRDSCLICTVFMSDLCTAFMSGLCTAFMSDQCTVFMSDLCTVFMSALCTVIVSTCTRFFLSSSASSLRETSCSR